MSRSWNIAVALSLLIQVSHAQGTFQVRLAESRYLIEPGTTIRTAVLIDPLPSEGLFGFSLKLVYDSKFLRVEGIGSVTLPAALDHDGVLGDGAFTAVESDSTAVRGSVDPLALPPAVYRGQELVTITLREVGGTIGSASEIKVELYRTLGPTETAFVSGDGRSLDGSISFGSSVVQVVPVVPEPGLGWLALASGVTSVWIGIGRRGSGRVLADRMADVPAVIRTEALTRFGGVS